MQPLAYLLNVNAPHESPRWEQVGEDHKLGDDVVPVVPFSDYETLHKENEELRFKALAAISPRVKQSYEREIKGLEDQIEAQAKRIAELEEHVTKLGSGSRQHLYKAFARRYKEILSLRKENEVLRKQVGEHKEWHMMRDEMRKALEAQMGRSNKWQS